MDKSISKIKRLKTLDTYRAIQSSLSQYIRDANLRAGDKLPSQQVLAERLGVSHVALREALRSMEALGIVWGKKGSGWYIKDFSFEPVAKGLSYTLELDTHSLADLNEIRICLETNYLIHAIRTLKPEDLDELDHIANAMIERAEAGASWHDLDHQFHRKLFSTIRNKLFGKWMEIFWIMYSNFSSTRTFPYEGMEVVRMHRDLVDAIRQGDGERATSTLHDNIAKSMRRFNSSTEHATNQK